MTSREEADEAREAVGIYAVMAREPTDALDMILDMIRECTSARVLDTLLLMLKGEGSANTDRELNAIFVGPVERRLAALK